MKRKAKQILTGVLTIAMLTGTLMVLPSISRASEDEEVDDEIGGGSAKGCRATGNWDDYCTAVKDKKIYGCANNAKGKCNYIEL